MYPKILCATSCGKTYEYVYLCGSVWKNGRSHRRTVLSLGRKDLIEPHLDCIHELCRGQRPASPDDPIPVFCALIGPSLALLLLLGTLSESVFILVLNRLTDSCSEHALVHWLSTFFVCDSEGRLFVPVYLSVTPSAKPLTTRASACRPSYCSAGTQLWTSYWRARRTLNSICSISSAALFRLRGDLLLYDLTSS